MCELINYFVMQLKIILKAITKKYSLSFTELSHYVRSDRLANEINNLADYAMAG